MNTQTVEMDSEQDHHQVGSNSKRRKFLVFRIDSELYAVTLSSVMEVIGMTPITEVPQVHNCFKGLINLRGKIITVIDLRLRLELPEKEHLPKKTAIIIVETGDSVMGVIVADILEVASYFESLSQKLDG